MNDVIQVHVGGRVYVTSVTSLSATRNTRFGRRVQSALDRGGPHALHFPEEDAALFGRLLELIRGMPDEYAEPQVREELAGSVCRRGIAAFGLEDLFPAAEQPPDAAELAISEEIAAPVVPTVLYLLGGFESGTYEQKAGVIEYNTASDMWRQSPLPPMPRASHDHTAATLHGVLYLVGGRDADGGELEGGYKLGFDRSWSAIADMVVPRYGHCSVPIGEYIYAIGGYAGQAGVKSVERYCPQADRWSPVAPLNLPRENARAVVLDGKIVVMGGTFGMYRGAFGDDPMRSVEIMDPATGQWRFAPPMCVARESMSAAILHSKLYVFGGVTREEEPISSVECYDPAVGQWELLEDRALPELTGRGMAGCAAVGDSIYIVGGFVGYEVGTSCLRFDPLAEPAQAYRPIRSMPLRISRFATVVG